MRPLNKNELYKNDFECICQPIFYYFLEDYKGSNSALRLYLILSHCNRRLLLSYLTMTERHGAAGKRTCARTKGRDFCNTLHLTFPTKEPRRKARGSNSDVFLASRNNLKIRIKN